MPIERTCKVCGSTFYVKPTVVARGSGNFYSRECRKKRVTRICETCGISFIAQTCLVAIGKAKYCSRKCSPYGTPQQVLRTCVTCGIPFTVKPSIVHKGQGNFCSRQCFWEGRLPRAEQKMVSRFWSKIDKSGGPEACWPWRDYANKKGYGVFGLPDGTLVLAHRMAYELTVGPIPEGLLGTHECDNPPCCNPAHITPGTYKKNYDDIIKRTGHAPGSRLTAEQVHEIRSSHATLKSLSEKYDVSINCIWGVRHFITYRHVPSLTVTTLRRD